VVGASDKPPGAAPWTERKYILAAERKPDLTKLPRAVMARTAGHPRSIDRADGRADQETGMNAVFGEGFEHPNLESTKASAT
jgi:hypothetical protein